MRFLIVLSILFTSIPVYSASNLDRILEAAASYFRSSDPQRINIDTCEPDDCLGHAKDLYEQKEFKFALPFYEKSFELNEKSISALARLNVIYRDGLGVEVDSVKADYYEQTRNKLFRNKNNDELVNALQFKANDGDPSAQFELSQFYGSPIKSQRNLSESLAWLITASENNHERAQYLLSKKLYKESRSSNKAISIKWMKKAAKNGYLQAQFDLGRNLVSDEGDVMEGLFWLGVATERGHYNAGKVLNLYYLLIIEEIRRKTKKHRKYYPELTINDIVNWGEYRANIGDTLTQLLLQTIYANKKLSNYFDNEKSMYWGNKRISTLIEKADNGSHLAMIDLAMIYKKGIGLAIDLNKSLYWHKKSLLFKKNNARFEIPRIEKELKKTLNKH